MDLERRLATLERRQRIAATAVVLALGAAWLAGARAGDDEVLRARKIEMIDAEGRVRAELAIDADGSAGLFLRDAEGRVRGCAIHDEAQTGFFALDTQGQVRVGAAQFAHGGGGFALHGEEGKGSAVLYYKGAGSLKFYGSDGAVKHSVGE